MKKFIQNESEREYVLSILNSILPYYENYYRRVDGRKYRSDLEQMFKKPLDAFLKCFDIKGFLVAELTYRGIDIVLAIKIKDDYLYISRSIRDMLYADINSFDIEQLNNLFKVFLQDMIFDLIREEWNKAAR